MTISLQFDIHGELLQLATESQAIVQAVGELLSPFACAVAAEDPRRPLELVVHTPAGADQLPELPAAAEHVSDGRGEGYRLYREGGSCLLDFRPVGLFRLDLGAGRLDSWLVDPQAMPPEQLDGLLRLAVIELLRLRGLYAIHAAALEKDGHGFLLAGPCGHGKTTACLALVRAGFRCLSDDHPLLRQTADGLELLPFLCDFNVTEKTIGFFDELQLARTRGRPGAHKQSFRVQEVFPAATARPCRPSFLIFPRIVDWPESHLEPLPRSRALEELLPESMLVLERELAGRQFQALAHLVQSAACYRLHFGENVLRLPAVLERLPALLPACA
jgi:hypothetical protein